MKYELTTTKHPNNPDLRQIKALRNIPTLYVRKGDLGGWVESENNLSQEGDCWIFGGAQVFENARISDSAQISGDSHVHGSARVADYAKVTGDSQVTGDSRVFGHALISGYALVRGDALISGSSTVLGHSLVSGYVEVTENAQVAGNARIIGSAKVCGSAKVAGNSLVTCSAIVSDNASIEKESDCILIGAVGGRPAHIVKQNDGSYMLQVLDQSVPPSKALVIAKDYVKDKSEADAEVIMLQVKHVVKLAKMYIKIPLDKTSQR